MTPYYADEQVTLLLGDARTVTNDLPEASVDCCVTSPPYFGLRDYGTTGQIGLEPSPEDYIAQLVQVFRGVRHALRPDGTLWLNLGDSYVRAQETNVPQSKNLKVAYPEHSKTGSSDGAVGRGDRPGTRAAGGLGVKNLLGIPWRAALALQADGWVLRNAIVWHKPNAMPESVTDRLSTRYELVFLLTPGPSYWFDLDAIREQRRYEHPPRETNKHASEGHGQRFGPNARSMHATGAYQTDGKNPGDVWSINTRPYSEAHFATFPIDLPTRCIKAGCRPGGTVLDPFSGSGTTGAAARNLDRKYVGIDLNPAYHDLAVQRFAQGVLTFSDEVSA